METWILKLHFCVNFLWMRPTVKNMITTSLILMSAMIFLMLGITYPQFLELCIKVQVLFFFHYQNLGKYFLVSIKMNSIKNYDKLILTSSFGTLSSTSAFSCDHNKLLFKLANMSDENILKADILLPPSAPHKYLDLK